MLNYISINLLYIRKQYPTFWWRKPALKSKQPARVEAGKQRYAPAAAAGKQQYRLLQHGGGKQSSVYDVEVFE